MRALLLLSPFHAFAYAHPSSPILFCLFSAPATGCLPSRTHGPPSASPLRPAPLRRSSLVSDAQYEWQAQDASNPAITLGTLLLSPASTPAYTQQYLRLPGLTLTEGRALTFTCCSPSCSAPLRGTGSTSLNTVVYPSGGVVSLAVPASAINSTASGGRRLLLASTAAGYRNIFQPFTAQSAKWNSPASAVRQGIVKALAKLNAPVKKARRPAPKRPAAVLAAIAAAKAPGPGAVRCFNTFQIVDGGPEIHVNGPTTEAKFDMFVPTGAVTYKTYVSMCNPKSKAITKTGRPTVVSLGGSSSRSGRRLLVTTTPDLTSSLMTLYIADGTKALNDAIKAGDTAKAFRVAAMFGNMLFKGSPDPSTFAMRSPPPPPPRCEGAQEGGGGGGLVACA